MPNLLISYPKSGLTWTRARVVEYLGVVKGVRIEKLAQLHSWLITSHLGYDQHSTLLPLPASKFPLEAPQIFILLRQAEQVLNSIWQRDSKSIPSSSETAANAPFPADEFGDPLPAKDFPSTLEVYIQSPYGLPRYLQFLNDIHRLVKLRPDVKFLFYEDMFSLDSVDCVSDLLGQPPFDNFTREKIFFNTRIDQIKTTKNLLLSNLVQRRHVAVGNRESYKQHFSNDSLLWIQQQLESCCCLNQYRERYL